MRGFILLAIFFCGNAYAIKNGINTTYSEYQNIVHLRIGQSICTGVRVSPYFVMTVSHCFKGKNFTSFNVTYLDDSTNTKFKLTNERIYHYDIIYKSFNKLDREIAIFPINPFYPDGFSADAIIMKLEEILENRLGTIVGFGTNTSKNSFGLKRGQVSIGTLTYEDQYLTGTREDNPQVLYIHPLVDSNQLACPGDSGGPLYIEKNGKRYLVGLVSRILAKKTRRPDKSPEGYCKRGVKSIYLPLMFHKDFIANNSDIILD